LKKQFKKDRISSKDDNIDESSSSSDQMSILDTEMKDEKLRD
jgi:hypothetical protein